MPIILECVLRAAGNETHTERERAARKKGEREDKVCEVLEYSDY